jgi:phage-related protein
MSQLGKAYIEVKADLKKFPAELRAQLKAAMAEGLAGVEFTGLEVKAKESGAKAADEAGKAFERRSKDRLRRAGEEGGRSLLGGLKRIFSRDSGEGRGFFGSISDFFASAFAGAGDAAKTAASSGASSGGGLLSGIGSQLGGLSSIGGGAGGVLQVAAFAVIIPVVIQLAGALVQAGAALLALPAAAAVAGAAIAPLIIAFQGFGEAVGAGLSGDTEKYNEALKKLAPSARSVVKEFVALGPQFKSIKANVQGAFFKPLQGFFTEFGRTLLPLANRGLTQIAGSLGTLARGLGNVFTSPENLRTFNALFASTSRIVATLGPAFASLAQAMLNLIQPALPFLERGATLFAAFSAHVEAFTRNATSGGKVTAWLERAFHILGSLVGVAKQLGQYILILFSGEIGDNGTKFIDELKVKLEDFLNFLRSPQGQEGIHNLAVGIKFVADAFLLLIAMEPAVIIALNAVADAVRWVGRFLQALGGTVVTAGKLIAGFFVMLWGWVKTAGSAIGSFFTDTIPGWFHAVVDFFQALPGRVVDALHDFQESGRAFLVDALKSWYDAVFHGIGEIIGVILSLPQLIPAALDLLGETLSNAWDAAWAFAVEAVRRGIQIVVDTITGIPGALATAGTAILDFFSGLWTNVVETNTNLVKTGYDNLVSFLFGLPGRVAALGPKLYNAAVNLGREIGRGLSNIGNFASDIGGKIVSTIKSGINWVINSINSGIADIDAKLPGTLPRIPQLAKGAMIDTPTLALVGEAGPEVVVPLGDPKRAQELAEQSGLLSMLRGAGGGTVVNVVAYLDPSGVIIPITRTVVNDTMDAQGDELAFARAA